MELVKHKEKNVIATPASASSADADSDDAAASVAQQ